MKFNQIMHVFVPKENKFHALLKRQSNILVTGSESLLEFLQLETHEERAQYYPKIKDIEHNGDVITNDIFEALNTTFITPFDREDIHRLGFLMDEVMDLIDATAKRFVYYKPEKVSIHTLKLARTMLEAAQTLNKAVAELDQIRKSTKEIKRLCEVMHQLENRADDEYAEFLIQLFETEKDAIELIKQKEILRKMENCVDTAEVVVKLIKTIIIKYA